MSQAAKQAKILLRGIFQRPFWQAWSLLLVGLVGTAVVAWETRKNLELTAKKQFQSACAEIQIKINDRFKAHELILRSGVAFYENSGGINRQAWHTFAEHHQLEQVLPGIQGLGFALLVPREQLARHLQEIRAEGFPEYQVRPEGDRAIYSSIIYLEPFTNRNLRAFGYDMLTEPVRREAMERARDSGTAALSGKVTLVQETDQDVQTGTLMYLPVYRPGMSHTTIAQRRESIIGWVYSPYRMNDLMRGILGKWEWMGGQRIRLQVFDGGQKLSPEALIFDSHPEEKHPGQQSALLNVQSRFFAAGRSWVLNFTPDGRQAAAMDYGKVWIILICGLSISLMLYRLETLLLATRANAREMQLLIETNPDNVILKDGKGRWMVANEPAKKLFQLGDDESWHGKTDAELAGINPRLRMFHEACIKSDEQTWKEGRHNVVTEQGVGPDGKLQEHEVYKTPLFLPGGRRQGLVIIGRDMTARRQMERNLRCSEAMASQSRDVILRILNSDGRILDANAAAESKYGYSRAELLAKTIYDLREKTDAAQSSQQMSLAFGQGILFETVHVCKDGSRLPVEVSSQGIQLEGEACIISVIRDISSRKKVEKRLQQLETAVAASATGIFLADRHGCITWANAAFSRLTGYANEEVMGCTPRFLNSGRHSDEFYKKMWGTILAGNVWKGELENRRKDGTIYFENKTITPVLDEAGKVSQFICVQEDVTERKRAEAQIQAAAVFNQSTIDALAAHLCVLDETGNILATNRAWKSFADNSQTPAHNVLVGGNYLAVCDATVGLESADASAFAAGIRSVIRGERDFFSLEYPCHSPQKQNWFLASVTRFNESVPARVVVSHENITERKQAEAALVAARDFHLQLLQNAPALIWRAGTDARCNWFNSTWLAFTGRTLAQEQGDGWSEGVHPEDLASYAKKFQGSFHRRESFTLEYRLRRHDGEYRWIADCGQPFDLPGGGFGGYIGYCYDIHESKMAHELLELRVADRTREIGMLSEVIDQSSVAFAMTNPDGSFITVNEAYARLLGYSRAEILDKKLKWIKELTPPEWRPVSSEKLDECLRT
ncbi:MAG: PAS domain S-box protein, partial [Verrucomicrobiota bacterium]